MKYYEVVFNLTPCSQDAQDILSAMAGEAGFETFEETATGLKGYVQQALFDEEVLKLVLEGFPFENVSLSYSIQEVEDKDWNEQWEQEGFEPISLPLPPSKREGNLIIHDGRHLPTAVDAQPSDICHQSSDIMIEIDAHLAFGTGTHETTRMICSTLLEMELAGTRVLDCGCGTGILGICALKAGAASVVSYDIDEFRQHTPQRCHQSCGRPPDSPLRRRQCAQQLFRRVQCRPRQYQPQHSAQRHGELPPRHGTQGTTHPQRIL